VSAVNAPFTPGEAARALHGRVVGKNRVRAPSPGMPASDESLEIKFGPTYADGFAVNDYYGGNDDWQRLKDYVREACGKPWEPSQKKDDPVQRMNARASKDFNETKPQTEKAAKREKEKLGPIVKTYDYTEADGTLLYQVTRHNPKDFRQRMPDGKGGWIDSLEGLKGRRVLYRWHELAQWPDATVVVCEGEKDADRVAYLGNCATTVASGTWTAECVDALKGRDVFILQDNDDAGVKRAQDAAKALHGIAKSIRIVLLPDLPEKGDVSDWLDADFSRAPTLDRICLDTPEWKPDPDEPPAEEEEPPTQPQPIELFWHGKAKNNEPRSWLFKDLIPEKGKGLASGQWGVAKTFCVLDLSASAMTATPFAGRENTRRGGVLFVAAEGANEIPIRLQGLVEHKLRPAALVNGAMGEPSTVDLEALPFAWIEETPDLKDDNSFKRLKEAAKSAALNLQEQFDLPLVLIVIDTLSAAANFKDQNDSAEGQFVMNRLEELSKATGAFVLAVDHFGKVADTGTRGTSAKEGAADVVLALLGDREINGTISNTRMALRKLRGGKTGTETPFDLRVVALGIGETTCIIEWRAERPTEPVATGKKDRWPQSLRVFRSALTTALVEHGKKMRPFGNEGPELRTVSDNFVRDEFVAAYPGDTADAKRMAFKRALKTARDKSLICSREIAGIDHLWLTDEQDKPNTH
jgi:hypothetical protein